LKGLKVLTIFSTNNRDFLMNEHEASRSTATSIQGHDIDSESYTIYHGADQSTVIPTTAFQSVEDQKDFERLLAKCVPRLGNNKKNPANPTS
jgi:hypothetical protein